REDEPIPEPDAPTDDQVGLVVLRAHLEFERAQTLIRPMPAEQRAAELAEIDAEIEALEQEITLSGLRGRTAPRHGQERGDRGGRGARLTCLGCPWRVGPWARPIPPRTARPTVRACS